MDIFDLQALDTGASPTFFELDLTGLRVSGTGTFGNVDVTLDLDVGGTATIIRLLAGGVNEN